MSDERLQERRAMIFRADRWIKFAVRTGDADAAITGMLREDRPARSGRK